MKNETFFILLLFFSIVGCSEQNSKNVTKATQINIKKSFLKAEEFLESDDILLSQKWLDQTKKLVVNKKIDTTIVFIHSLQSELLYYGSLYQFGVNEAEKCILKAKQLNDSLLISNGYFFKGINLFELNKYEEAEKSLWKSKQFQPAKTTNNYIRSAIQKEHIFNNLAQLKLQIQQLDSAIWYNRKAYIIAKSNISKRAIPNIEQTFSQIYLKENKNDSAIFYLYKSIQSAQKHNYNDIVLIDYGYLMHAFLNNPLEFNNCYSKGLDLIQKHNVNIAFQLYFYKTAVDALKKTSEIEKRAFAQERWIAISEEIAAKKNSNIQNIIEDYIKGENKLLKQELNLIKNQKEKQIYFVLILFLTLVVFGVWYFFRQRQKLNLQEINVLKHNQELATLEALIDGEEKERKRIAQELHDGLNSDLSAIKYRMSTLEESSLNALDTENITKVIAMLDECCSQVRNISHNLMPSSIIEYGLVESIREYCIKISNTVDLKIDFQTFGAYIALSKKNETIVYRIIQELLTNMLKHAKASEALIQLNYREDELFITVEDNGIGFNKTENFEGIGHKNIQTRVAFLNAQLDIDSSSKGTSYTISIDLNKIK